MIRPVQATFWVIPIWIAARIAVERITTHPRPLTIAPAAGGFSRLLGGAFRLTGRTKLYQEPWTVSQLNSYRPFRISGTGIPLRSRRPQTRLEASRTRTYSGCRRQDRAYGSVHARDVATQGFDILPDLLVLLMTFLVCTFAAWGVMQVGFEVAQSRGEIAELIGQQAAIA